MKDRLFFVLSGEHRTLPHAEIRAILQSQEIHFKQRAASTKLLRITAEPSALDAVARRSVMYEQCGFEIAVTSQGKRRLLSLLLRMDLSRHFAKRRSFAVRSLRVGGASRYLNRASLEREVGGVLKERSHGVGVNLDRPDVTFLCVVSSRGLLLGEVTHSRVPGLIASRRPRKRPVFHPSTMQPKLARCIVNLARPPEGATLLDPFCGVGGILLEAVAIRCLAIGADADPRMIRGARTNLTHYGAAPFGLIVADATKILYEVSDRSSLTRHMAGRHRLVDENSALLSENSYPQPRISFPRKVTFAYAARVSCESRLLQSDQDSS